MPIISEFCILLIDIKKHFIRSITFQCHFLHSSIRMYFRSCHFFSLVHHMIFFIDQTSISVLVQFMIDKHMFNNIHGFSRALFVGNHSHLEKERTIHQPLNS